MCEEDSGAHLMVQDHLHREFFHNHRTQKACAALLGISPQYLSDIASGRRRLAADMAVRMEEKLGWDAEDMWMRQAIVELNDARQRAFVAETTRPAA